MVSIQCVQERVCVCETSKEMNHSKTHVYVLLFYGYDVIMFYNLFYVAYMCVCTFVQNLFIFTTFYLFCLVAHSSSSKPTIKLFFTTDDI